MLEEYDDDCELWPCNDLEEIQDQPELFIPNVLKKIEELIDQDEF